jgi:bifunctional UDP-N-acetylglucosamine pyrophosphorylase / glucosamine-1-phosphate N-acetyltransferase
VIGAKAKIGNFVEAKNTTLGEGAKASHLTYLGDCGVGAQANIGAGTITCNYDGFNKHRTVIGERAFIGSNAAFVAPVTVGADAVIGAGSVVTSDVPADALGLARPPQRTIEGAARRLRERLAREKPGRKG